MPTAKLTNVPIEYYRDLRKDKGFHASQEYLENVWQNADNDKKFYFI
jgi:hypothetical protein